MPRQRKIVLMLLLLALIAAIAACAYALHRAAATPGHRAPIYAWRIAIIITSLAAWFTSQSLIGAAAQGATDIGDAIHNLTAPLNRYLLSHPRAANILLMISSALIDLLGIFLILISIFGPSIRPFASLLLLFLLRQIAQATCALPAPPGLIWRNPGFPSLLVTYGVANDFFFSGHTSIAVLAAIELSRIAPWWLAVIGFAIALFEAAVVLILRAHYTMDVFTGIIAAFLVAVVVHGPR